MKSRITYLLISGIIILSVFTGTIIWRNTHLKDKSKFNEKSFTSPISSIYIPTNAELVFHWKVNPTTLPKYIGSYQDKKNKSITDKQIKLIRDSYFKLMSLDFTKDISNWAGEYGSFAIFDIDQRPLNDWLIVLEINKNINIDEELELITGEKIIDENTDSSNKATVSKSKIITKRINSDQSIYFSNQRDHILISSNPKIINFSIKQLGINSLSTKEKYKNILLKNNINDGILLLELSPKKIFKMIGQDENLLELDKTDKLLSSLNIGNKEIKIEGIFSYETKSKRPINDINYDFTEMKKEFNLADNLILINNPKQYFGKHSINPYQKLITSVIQKSIAEDYSNLFKIILKNTEGELIWLKDKGWLAITQKARTDKKQINNILEKDKFSRSNIEFKNKNLEVWSKLTTQNNQQYEIKEDIEAITEENKDVYIWSQDLTSISNLDNKKYSPNSIDNYYIENENHDYDDVIRIHLGNTKAEVLLNNFYPYILLRAMLGNQLDIPQNIDISLAIPTINYPDFVKFKINLNTS